MVPRIPAIATLESVTPTLMLLSLARAHALRASKHTRAGVRELLTSHFTLDRHLPDVVRNQFIDPIEPSPERNEPLNGNQGRDYLIPLLLCTSSRALPLQAPFAALYVIAAEILAVDRDPRLLLEALSLGSVRPELHG